MKFAKLISVAMVATTLGVTTTMIAPSLPAQAKLTKAQKKAKQAKAERKHYTASQWAPSHELPEPS